MPNTLKILILICLILNSIHLIRSDEVPEEFWDTWEGFAVSDGVKSLENLTELCSNGNIPFINIKEFTIISQHKNRYDLVLIYTYHDNLKKCLYCEFALKSLALLSPIANAANQAKRNRPLFVVALDIENSKLVESIPFEHLPLISYQTSKTMKVYDEKDFSVYGLRRWLATVAKLKLVNRKAFNYRKIFLRIALVVFIAVTVCLCRHAIKEFLMGTGIWASLVVLWSILFVSGLMFTKISNAPFHVLHQDQKLYIHPTARGQLRSELIVVGVLCKYKITLLCSFSCI